MLARTRLLGIILMIVALLGVPYPAAAVTLFGGGKAGFTVSEVSGTNEAGVTAHNSGIGGGILAWEINHWFTTQLEATFTQKGANLEGLATAPPHTELRLTYFELPLLGKFKWTSGPPSRMGPFATLGPVLSINTQAKLRISGADQNVNQEIRGVDWGVAFGVGFDFDIGTGLTTVDMRYVLGLQDIFKDSSSRPEKSEDFRNRALQLTVAWIIPFGL